MFLFESFFLPFKGNSSSLHSPLLKPVNSIAYSTPGTPFSDTALLTHKLLAKRPGRVRFPCLKCRKYSAAQAWKLIGRSQCRACRSFD